MRHDKNQKAHKTRNTGDGKGARPDTFYMVVS